MSSILFGKLGTLITAILIVVIALYAAVRTDLIKIPGELAPEFKTLLQRSPAVNNPQGSTSSSAGPVDKALEGNETVKCIYSGGNKEITIYTKEGMLRTKGTITPGINKVGSSILKNNQIWLWGETSRVGFTIRLPDSSKNADDFEMPGKQRFREYKEKILAQARVYQKNCTTIQIPDSRFSPPANIQFTDLNEYIRQAQDLLNKRPQLDKQLLENL